MRPDRDFPLLSQLSHLNNVFEATADGERCLVAPSPELRSQIKKELDSFRAASAGSLVGNFLRVQPKVPIGMNDGLIRPGTEFPLGTAAMTVQRAAADRAPLRGQTRVIVVLVDFEDQVMVKSKQHFQDLFFSTGVLQNGSVREYFSEVTNGLIEIVGEVVGPFRLPKKMSEYANGNSGTGGSEPNARTMARDAAIAADPAVNFGPYDNDGDSYVDAFVVVHAGNGAETTGNVNEIWSHKWLLPGGAYNADSAKIYAYLTVPEGAKIGVCCHELGHLLFGFPDLYDTDYSSEGVGNWCLMGGGSWLGGGETPAHPSAWCKAQQGWVNVIQPNNGPLDIEDVKTGKKIYRFWKNKAASQEYFLVENRQKTLYDRNLPGDGLLIWHIDDATATNSNEIHPKVALVQADGNKDLENGNNRGDPGDPYPGSANNRMFNSTTNPHSKSYAGLDTCVKIEVVGSSGPTIATQVELVCATGGGDPGGGAGGDTGGQKKGCLPALAQAFLGIFIRW